MTSQDTEGTSWGARFRALVQDAELRRRFLPPMSDEEVDAVQRLLDPVAKEALEWCERYRVLNPAIVAPTALWTIVQLPRLPAESLGLVMKTALWVVALDDLLDSQSIAPLEMQKVVGECLLIGCEREADSVARSIHGHALAEIKGELSQYSLWHALHPYWLVSLSLMLDGMAYDFWLQRGFYTRGEAPRTLTMEEYLHFASHSYSAPHQWMATLVVEGDPTVVPALPSLWGLMEQCGTVLRLANDLATSPREEKEARVNALVIARQKLQEQEPLLSPTQVRERAKNEVGARLRQESAEARSLAENVSTPTQVERRLLRAIDFGIELHARHDLRDWVASFESAASSQGFQV